MGLRQQLASYAARRPHALLAEVPGWWDTRVAVERAVLRRGWRLAVSPADADVLVICGRPGERLTEVVDRVWDQLPGPRARVAVTGIDVTAALDEAVRRLSDHAAQRADANWRPPPYHDEAYSGSSEHAHHDGGVGPAGIPLATGSADRDGLQLDVLHVPLGPLLAQWPPGLVLRCVLHGDVVTEAEVEVLDGPGDDFPTGGTVSPVLGAAAACDSAARMLTVAGWDDAALAARQVRDLVLDDAEPGRIAGQIDRLRSRVIRAWPLRWLLRGLGTVDAALAQQHGLSADTRGDVHDRLVAMLTGAVALLRGQAQPVRRDTRALLGALPTMVTGLDLGAVRLVVASCALETVVLPRSELDRA